MLQKFVVQTWIFLMFTAWMLMIHETNSNTTSYFTVLMQSCSEQTLAFFVPAFCNVMLCKLHLFFVTLNLLSM